MRKLFLVLTLLFAYTLRAQLVIAPGTQFSIAGNMRLTLHNADLINNGNIIPGNSVINFTGNVSSKISGGQLVQFHELEISKTNNSSVILQQAISVKERILFVSGFFNLNGFNTDLGTTGRLENEHNDSRVTGANGGQVIVNKILNAPGFENPGNLGAIISSAKNLGSVIIRRGHQSQNGSGLDHSMLRYFDIMPENNVDVNAMLQINYLNAELNGSDENSLVFFRSDNGVNWSNEGFTSRIPNFITSTAINSFSRFTLSSDNNPLPVYFILFNANCEDNKVAMVWKTAQEQNSSRFNVERSIDGIQWTVIGSVPAAGNSNIEKRYSFTDNNPLPNSFYRIAEVGLDGRKQFTGILRSSCTVTGMFDLWPNPTHDKVFINIVSNHGSQAVVRLFDSKGALIKIERATVLTGSNQLTVNMGSLSKGVYHLSVEWNNGQMKKAVQVLKQ